VCRWELSKRPYSRSRSGEGAERERRGSGEGAEREVRENAGRCCRRYQRAYLPTYLHVEAPTKNARIRRLDLEEDSDIRKPRWTCRASSVRAYVPVSLLPWWTPDIAQPS
jgi:hypothetical protein